MMSLGSLDQNGQPDLGMLDSPIIPPLSQWSTGAGTAPFQAFSRGGAVLGGRPGTMTFAGAKITSGIPGLAVAGVASSRGCSSGGLASASSASQGRESGDWQPAALLNSFGGGSGGGFGGGSSGGSADLARPISQITFQAPPIVKSSSPHNSGGAAPQHPAAAPVSLQQLLLPADSLPLSDQLGMGAGCGGYAGGAPQMQMGCGAGSPGAGGGGGLRFGGGQGQGGMLQQGQVHGGMQSSGMQQQGQMQGGGMQGGQQQQQQVMSSFQVAQQLVDEGGMQAEYE